MWTFDEFVSWIRSPEGAGFTSVTVDRAGQAVNYGARRLASRSLWLQEVRELGPTVADQEVYPVGSDVIDVVGLEVGGDPQYKRLSLNELWKLKAGQKFLPRNLTGSFSPYPAANGVKQFSINPIPDTSGQAITALVAVTVARLSSGDALPFPDDAEDAIKAYAKADLYDDVDEDPNSAQVQRAAGDAYAGELLRRGKSQVGSGPTQMQLARAHF